MPKNIEVKAKVSDLTEAASRAKQIAHEFHPLKQVDTFFHAPKGCRLKLRFEERLADGENSAVLISYERADVVGPKTSNYVMSTVADPFTMKQVLAMSNGISGTVEKRRDAYLVKRGGITARVHLDTVTDLGEFIEFEVIVEEDTSLVDAEEFADYLTDYFSIHDEDRIPGAYWNLIYK